VRSASPRTRTSTAGASRRSGCGESTLSLERGNQRCPSGSSPATSS
jgi:hypothetical protein